MLKRDSKYCMRGQRIEDQASDFTMHAHTVFEAIASAHEKHLGVPIMVGRKVERAVEEDILDLCISMGRYDPWLKDYMDHNGYIYEYSTS